MKKIALAVLIVMAMGLRAGHAQQFVNSSPADKSGAREGVRIGVGVACDTEGQIERYASLMGGNEPKLALQMVNDEARNPVACGAVMIAYTVNKEIGNIRNEKGFFKIIEIDVLAASSPQGWRLISPMAKQYIAVQEVEA
jgi:hypothetical protein